MLVSWLDCSGVGRGGGEGRLSAIGRTTPCLLGLFSRVVLMAYAAHPHHLPTRHAAWYGKTEATFIDALAAVGRQQWASRD